MAAAAALFAFAAVVITPDARRRTCASSEIPAERKFDAISAVEMAEHVGIANFGLFLHNVREMLEDDGLFYMQVAGLRKGSNWQDTQWGLFMSRYIFPGADASTPLYWYIKQLGAWTLLPRGPSEPAGA